MKRSYLTFGREKTPYYEDNFKLTLEKLIAANTFLLRHGDSYTFYNSSDVTTLVPERQKTFTKEKLPLSVKISKSLEQKVFAIAMRVMMTLVWK